MISHYQNENNRDYTFNKYNNDDSEKNILNDYYNISEKFLKKNETNNNINNDNNNNTIKQKNIDIKNNPNNKKNIKNYNNNNLTVIPETVEKKNKINALTKLKNQFIDSRKLTPNKYQMKKKNDSFLYNTMKVNYSKNSFKNEDIYFPNKLYTKNQINEFKVTESMNKSYNKNP
jgi:hypothetical protein